MTGTMTVRDRRHATLGRVQDGRSATRRDGSAKQPRQHGRGRALRSMRQNAERVSATPAVTGPPPGIWFGIIGVVFVFVMLGLVMVLSASAVTQANLGNSPYHVFSRQAMWAGLGVIGMIVAARIPYGVWRKLVVPLGLLGVAAMFGPFAPGIGANLNGADAWIRFGAFSVQPSEFLKLVVVIVAADVLTRRADALNDRRGTLLPLGLIAAAGAGLCLMQKDLGSAVVLGGIVLAIAWISGVPFTPLATMSGLGLAVGVVFVTSSQRRVDRFTAFLNVAEEKDHLAYQTYQGFVSMASGGLTGSGIGGSKGKLGYLPYAHSDFIFAIIADELGMIGAGAVIGGFIALVWFGVQTALAAPDRFGMLLAGGIASWFAIQTIINLGGVTGVLPVTGLTLPFFSAGGSSLFVSMVAAGLLLSVTRRVGSGAPR